MHHFHFGDLTKAGSVDITDGKITCTVTNNPHNKIREKQAADAKKAAEAKNKKNAERFLALYYGHREHDKHK
ncbi:hypothetical protein DL89DRAFT_290939 [Linderina pennispora]|uniref:Uncharacterized protein n=1 Tax=Linderina pennispora TaxID=61395 RepID=A0A1Y1WJ08_9FUNG|nr:uncharacterized protein DL89DRAFT_290939 [Linderina pennispora]ORX73206.1 hypothetical protein DL89DRAFT_290939 [Linderina pennispora]